MPAHRRQHATFVAGLAVVETAGDKHADGRAVDGVVPPVEPLAADVRESLYARHSATHLLTGTADVLHYRALLERSEYIAKAVTAAKVAKVVGEDRVSVLTGHQAASGVHELMGRVRELLFPVHDVRLDDDCIHTPGRNDDARSVLRGGVSRRSVARDQSRHQEYRQQNDNQTAHATHAMTRLPVSGMCVMHGPGTLPCARSEPLKPTRTWL